MRCRYCSTMCRELVRPSTMAFWISGIVASTTLKVVVVAGLLGVWHAGAAAARRMMPAREYFMAGILGAPRLKGEHLRVLHHQPPSRRLRDVGELRLVVDDEEVAQRAVNQVEAHVRRELLHVVAILQQCVEKHVGAE